ncbi:hypothetical protein B0H13DRAFT_1900455 [Mycena leptocephala]|nr:hypothetical protein B0H13DRAFT_1900455 [Mycena leptocephala]
MLAVQLQLDEPLNLNGDLLGDLMDDRVVYCPNDGDAGIEAVFLFSGGGPLVADRMLKFRSDHVIYDEEHRPYTFRRLEKTRFSITDPIPVITKRKGTRDVEGEPPSKRTKSNPVRKPVQTKRQPKATKGKTEAYLGTITFKEYYEPSAHFTELSDEMSVHPGQMTCAGRSDLQVALKTSRWSRGTGCEVAMYVLYGDEYSARKSYQTRWVIICLIAAVNRRTNVSFEEYIMITVDWRIAEILENDSTSSYASIPTYPPWRTTTANELAVRTNNKLAKKGIEEADRVDLLAAVKSLFTDDASVWPLQSHR